MNKYTKGYTLIELLILITFFSVLIAAGIAIYVIAHFIGKWW